MHECGEILEKTRKIEENSVKFGAPKGSCFDQGLFSEISSRGFRGLHGSSKYT